MPNFAANILITMKPYPGNNIGREKHILMLSTIAPARGLSSAGSNIVSESDPVFEKVFEKANEDYQRTY
jgi:hypothetical protein